jgi:hypothetical protein
MLNAKRALFYGSRMAGVKKTRNHQGEARRATREALRAADMRHDAREVA